MDHPDADRSSAMFLLRTLGSVQLLRATADGEQPLNTHAKRLALLLFLGRGGRGPLVRRDVLLGLFWPDSDQTHGRGALRQALTGLRRQLGSGAIITQGEEEVGLASGFLACDATDFEQACQAGRQAEAFLLYRGDFAAGFHVSGLGPDFDQWVEAERARLRHLALRSARSAATQEEGEGRPAEGVTLLRRAIQLVPDDEASVVHLIGLLDRMGDRSAALATYQAFERQLEAEYSAVPAPETRALIDAVRNRSDLRPVPSANAVTSSRGLADAGPAYARPRSVKPVAPALGSTRRILIAVGVIVTFVTGGVLTGLVRGTQPPTSAVWLIAVQPFKVSGADSTIRWLGEGIVDLLSNRLSGVPGLLVEGPDKREKYGRVVRGSVSGTGGRIILTARIEPSHGGQPLAQATVNGPADSLQALVDRLAIQLIGESAGLEAGRLAYSTSASLPAVRAFLAGRVAFRTGRMNEARKDFLEAVQADSNFAVAALDLYRTTIWVRGGESAQIGERRAIAGRSQLSPPDQALLDVLQGQRISAPALFDKWNKLITAYPDHPEGWYGLGIAYFRWGRLAGLDRALARAEVAFRSGWQVDSAIESRSAHPIAGPLTAEPILLMAELAHIRGDTAEVRRLALRGIAPDTSSDVARVLRWHLAMIEGDSTRHAFWKQFETASQHSAMLISLFISSSGIGMEDQARAIEADLGRLQAHDTGPADYAAWITALNRGRPTEVPPLRGADVESERQGLRSRVRAGIFWEGDSGAAVEAVRLLTRFAEAPATDARSMMARAQDVCTIGEWRAAQGDLEAVATASRQLLASTLWPDLGPKDSVSHLQYVQLCAALLDASLAVSREAPAEARVALVRADSLARTYIFQVCCALQTANLWLAQLWERAGDLPLALQAIKRRSTWFGGATLYLTSFLREEGRLAAMTGDTTDAILAYRRYLAFRGDPEPSLRPSVERVRQALAALRPGG